MTTTIEKIPAGLENESEQPKDGTNNHKTMKGLVYGGTGKIELKEIPKPGIEKPTDALVKIIKTMWIRNITLTYGIGKIQILLQCF